MKIELKSIKFNERMSEETNCFTANLYVNDKKLCYVENTGKGGCSDYVLYVSKNAPLLKEVEAYCKTLPDIKYNTITIKQNLETVIDELFENYLIQKESKKLVKYMEKGIVYGTLSNFQVVTWKGHTIAEMLTSPHGVLPIKNKLKELIRDGKNILNTNIPQQIFDNL